MTSLTVSAVVCTYSEDRWDNLQAAVASLLGQRPRPEQVLIVVDHNPQLLDRVRESFGASATCLPNTRERGLSGARNEAVDAAEGDIVAFLDDDAVTTDGWLAAIIDAFADPAALVVGGSSEPAWEVERPRWFPEEFDWVVGSTYRGMPEQPAVVRNVIGCNMAFRRDALKRAGGFVSTLGRVGRKPTGAEETEICIRIAAQSSASAIRYQPFAAVMHHVPRERARVSYFLARCWGEGRSKAILSRIAGADRALESERTYVRSTLPRGVGRYLRHAAGGDVWGLARAAAIASGLAVTASGYLVGRVASSRPRADRSQGPYPRDH